MEVMPLTVLPVQEFEASQPFLHAISDFFDRWIAFNSNFNRSFSDFLVEVYGENPKASSTLIDTEYDNYAEEVKRRFFPSSGEK